MIDFDSLLNPVFAPSATDAEVRGLCSALSLHGIPPALEAVLKAHNGWTDDCSNIFFSTSVLPEIQETLEVGMYAPGYLVVANDGGGRVAMIQLAPFDEAVYVVDDSVLSPDGAWKVAGNLAEWIGSGTPFEPANTENIGRPDGLVDVYLRKIPSEGLKAAAEVRSIFSIDEPLDRFIKEVRNRGVKVARNIRRVKLEKNLEKARYVVVNDFDIVDVDRN